MKSKNASIGRIAERTNVMWKGVKPVVSCIEDLCICKQYSSEADIPIKLVIADKFIASMNSRVGKSTLPGHCPRGDMK